MSTTLTVIIPIRNRTGPRLENCLRSLRAQVSGRTGDGPLLGDAVEIILSDYGSDPEPAAEIRTLGAQYGAQVVRTDTTGLWNRSEALNVALRVAAGRYTLCTDADMIFEPNFLATIIGELQEADHLALVVCRCRDLPDLGPERLYEPSEFKGLKAQATMRQAMGTGACQATDTRWLRSIRGYDEAYVFWGFEDKDLVHRARRSGLELRWIHEQTSMLHQWHRTTKNDRYLRKLLNKTRYYLTRELVVKNKPTWGRGRPE